MSFYKLNIIEILYSELTNYQIKNSIQYLINKNILSQKQYKIFFKYSKILTEILKNIIDVFFLRFLNSDLKDLFFNFVYIDNSNKQLISKSKQKLFIYFIFNILISILKYLIKEYKNINIIIKKLKFYSEIIIKFLYIFNSNFLYSNYTDYIFNFIKINNKSNSNKLLKFIYFVFFIIVKYYNINYENNKGYKIPININSLIKNKIDLNVNNEKLKGKCFYCKKIYQKPIAMRCCGYVFCKKCAYKYCEPYCFSCKRKIPLSYILNIYN